MPSWKTQFGSYLKTEDLQGRRIPVTITKVVIEQVGDEEKGERKLVAYFHGANKTLVLNKTKCEALTHITGTDDFTLWRGARIVLAPGTTMYQGRTVGCVNIESPVAAAPTGFAPPPQYPPVPVPPPAAAPPAAPWPPEPGSDDEPPITSDDIPF